MFDLALRRVALIVAAPALLTLSAPAVATGPVVPPRPARAPAPPAPEETTAESASETVNESARTARPVTKPRPANPVSAARLRARLIVSQVLRITNRERREASCPAVALQRNLITASAHQSRYMARTKLFSHVWRNGSTLATRTRAARYRQPPTGENIAWGYRTAPHWMQA